MSNPPPDRSMRPSAGNRHAKRQELLEELRVAHSRLRYFTRLSQDSESYVRSVYTRSQRQVPPDVGAANQAVLSQLEAVGRDVARIQDHLDLLDQQKAEAALPASLVEDKSPEAMEFELALKMGLREDSSTLNRIVNRWWEQHQADPATALRSASQAYKSKSANPSHRLFRALCSTGRLWLDCDGYQAPSGKFVSVQSSYGKSWAVATFPGQGEKSVRWEDIKAFRMEPSKARGGVL